MSGRAEREIDAYRRKQCGGGFPMAMTGTVKFFNGERGYGFIKPDDGGRDVFVHITAVERAGLKDLTEGQRISFEVEPDDRKSTRLNSSHLGISYAVFCLKKKNKDR